MKIHLLMFVGVASLAAAPAIAQEPPPPIPPVSQQPPVEQQPPVTAPPVTELPTTPVPGAPPSRTVEELAASRDLSGPEVQRRLDAIYLMEGVLVKAVQLAARQTAQEIQRVEPGLMMFSSAPVKAHGTYLEGYGIVFHIEIPKVIPSVASLVETLGRERGRGNPAQQMSLGAADPVLNPSAHYVMSIKNELVNAMVRHSHSMELRPGETLTVSARDGSEVPGQVDPPSTMTLQVKGADLVEFIAGRMSLDEIRRRVTVRGF